jgi:hypothetical protein
VELAKWLVENDPIWWQNLKNDPDIYIEIRDPNLNAYYRGASILRLNWTPRGPEGNIHYKFIPLRDDNTTLTITINKTSNDLVLGEVKSISLDNFSGYALKLIKSRINDLFDSDSEQAIQAKYVLYNNINAQKGFFIDSECYPNQNRTDRFDMVWVDIATKKMVIVELKRKQDGRLFYINNDSIDNQLIRYSQVIRKSSDFLKERFIKIFTIKKELGLPSFSSIDIKNIDDYEIESRPLLIIGNCSDAWIDDNAKEIDARLNEIALGTIYQSLQTNNFRGLRQSSSRYYHWY